MMRDAPGPAQGILGYFVRHRTAANLLLVLMLAAGIAALPRMRAQYFPDIVVDDIRVAVAWDGAGAEDVDRAIVQLLDPALMAVEGVLASESRSTEGRASITLEFEPGWDMARAAEDVQSALDGVSSLPEEAEDPQITRSGWWDTVTDVVITGPVGTDQIARFADELVTRLFAEGVTRTTIRGLAAPRVVVEVPSLSLITHDVTMADISAVIAAEVDANPAGDVTGANARIRAGSEKRSASQIEALVLRSNPDGSTLTVGDLARVRVEGVDRERTYFVGDNPAISINVSRNEMGDAIDIQRRVEEVAAEMEATLPEGTSIDLIRTRAEQISGRLDILIENGAMGLGLVLALLFLFLNVRSAIWVAAGIPVAMLTAIALMYVSGLTLNMISLFALIITLGIVVDDAIVVAEYADARVRRSGEGPVEAAESAARRMAMPVFSATLTTIIAFFGLTVIEGRFGEMIADIPFTVIVVLLASLVECFLILPNHMSHALAHSGEDRWYDMPSRLVNRGFAWVRRHLFRPLMALVIKARYPVLALVVAIFATQMSAFIRGDLQWRFFSSPERGSVTGNFMMAPGATREDSLAMMQELQRATNALAARLEAEHGTNPLDYVIAEIGGNSGRPLAGSDTKDPHQLGAITIELIEPDFRPYSSNTFVAQLQQEVQAHPLAEVVSFRGWGSGPGGDSLEVQFYGADADVLKAASMALQQAVLRYPEVSAVEDNLSYDKEEMILELTPQGQALGFTVDQLGRVLRNRLNGIEAATYPVGPRSAAIRVELPESELSADFLERMMLRSPEGAYVPLADIVQVERRSGFSTVRRENGLRVLTVNGEISDDDPARAAEIQRTLETDILPRIAAEQQVEFRLGGLSEQEDRFMSDALFGFTMVMAGIYLVLSWVFASWTRPLVVMAIIPFGLVGTFYGHMIWDVPLSMFTVVGLLGMTGIIINDSIVLVSTIDEYAETRGLRPAIIDGAADRLRPVMLTTMTTVLGLAPLLYEKSSQAQFLMPTVITLVYGLGFGMVLVLLVVPALLAMQEDVARMRRGLRRALSSRRAGALQVISLVGVVLMLGWLGATMGHVIVTGSLIAPLAGLLPVPPLAAALLLFLSGMAALVLLLFLGAALASAGRRRAA
ncbi:Multidrug efflux pump subunit AcrB [Pseudooceanicola antarcticus]|uniref:AcrB/AcrD/AcrF family protein n=1 Tax=Pseudooceanicola antarcticus TaxID=1247613 RepID=A0A285IRV4_9RHOB|nr:efflux RND transporter permease subunit [Pseudooceanicola antarcticus]PJE31813.1 AcrB/AcrD/AcrF family protein [Pseudooceanicola antarcticus]SNY50447.1 Multidrug efflux pump subunit AcrB [Pseudooceanicola antarcticus]